ncbi:MAG: DNA polymerase III subunit epsilon [Thiotrichales bacterium]|jgi:DNA polymerase-3 subunit epsilon|nr:DNA polymerase III subunit epsilon [Thiotrichales bacterium]MBT3612912.1 DNA polymerase III subunit epsilon [Thiotrichales bacterium]MBT3752317.1 DNA polymerase III subunit epsilon [Thiotrichales bacterium]MBT4152488.1 DNA polymerase III subunit epsilon [Thiotrichales bacterium]MBT4261558.1 DNA polymerase III subunit epsilon [Thiotrichales bacterium]
MSRQIVLDTETTGLEPKQGHRVIEIGCVEMIDRRLSDNHYHQYINPEREVDAGAMEVHGITNKFLADKPRFAEVVEDFIEYVRGAELIIHNAPFDVGFLNHEFKLMNIGLPPLESICEITDSLQMARRQYPGQKNNLDAICRRLDIDNSQRTLHGALLDSEILAEVYLSMTGGQAGLDFDGNADSGGVEPIKMFAKTRTPLPVIKATVAELAAHNSYIEKISL